jgi:hypothetical protein
MEERYCIGLDSHMSLQPYSPLKTDQTVTRRPSILVSRFTEASPTYQISMPPNTAEAGPIPPRQEAVLKW